MRRFNIMISLDMYCNDNRFHPLLSVLYIITIEISSRVYDDFAQTQSDRKGCSLVNRIWKVSDYDSHAMNNKCLAHILKVRDEIHFVNRVIQKREALFSLARINPSISPNNFPSNYVCASSVLMGTPRAKDTGLLIG